MERLIDYTIKEVTSKLIWLNYFGAKGDKDKLIIKFYSTINSDSLFIIIINKNKFDIIYQDHEGNKKYNNENINGSYTLKLKRELKTIHSII